MHRYVEKALRADVLVAGGGTAGATAAIAAAEEGASVVLVERDTALGGVGVRVGVHNYYLGTRGGVQDRLDRDVLSINRRMGSASKGFLPESKGMAIARRVQELGIHVLYESIVAETIMDGSTVQGVVAETERERVRIEAAVTIDATADGDVAYLAGASYTLGREWDGALHNYSMVPRFVDANNQLRCKNFDVGWVDASDPDDVSRAYRIGRRHAWRKGENPQNTHYVALGPQLGLREGRLVRGEYTLRQTDFLLNRRFDDVVMRCYAHHENHAFDYANESEWSQIWVAILGMWRFGFGGDVPYRCFLPEGIDGLIVGCRALSQDHDNVMMLRMQRDLHKIGEVAGTAAALCAKRGTAPRRADVAELQARLLARGVLKPEELSGDRTPWMAFKGESAELAARLSQETPSDTELSALIGHLGGEQEVVALWWIRTLGPDVCVAPLLRELPRAEGRRRRGIAFALGLLRHEAAVPELAAAFRERDPFRPNELARTEARWVSAVMLLTHMKHPAVAADAVALLREERRSATLLFLLRYLVSVADRLCDALRAEAIAAIEAMLSAEGLGLDFELHNSGEALPALDDTRSIRWSLELNASYLSALLGGPGRKTLEHYLKDRRGYARAAARKLLERLSAQEGDETND